MKKQKNVNKKKLSKEENAMKILLMNGHGGNPYDSGATGNGYEEAELTRELADLVETRLKKYATVVRYPKDRNAFADVQSGTFTSKISGGIKNIGYAFEIHFNAYKKDETKDGKKKGSECYVTSREKGITVEQAIMKNLSKYFPLRDNDNIFDGVKRTNFAVIQTCKNYGVSGALLETCFIDDADDVSTYQANKGAIADAIVDGIATGFGLKSSSTGSTTSKPSTSKPSTSTQKKTISQLADEVELGKWGNGEARKKALEAAGYDYEAVQAEVNRRAGVTTSSKPSTSTSKKKLYLPKTAKSWRVYPTNKAPVVGNEVGYLYPSKFGGLTYDILATPQKDVVTIQTRDYGKVNIYVAASTGAVIK